MENQDKKLQELRKFLGYSAEEMAKELELNPRTYGSYERKETKLPLFMLKKLKEKYNININWLYDDNEEMFLKEINYKDEIKKMIEEINEEKAKKIYYLTKAIL